LREEVLSHLQGALCHQDWIAPATAYAVPFLLDVLQEPEIEEKSGLLEFLALIARADQRLAEERWRVNPRVPDWNVPQHIPFKDAHLEISRGIPLYVTPLSHTSPAIRTQAAHVLFGIASHLDLGTVEVRLLAQEEDPWVRVNLVLLFGALLRRQSEAQGLCDFLYNLAFS
jgi:hypothetical protein